MNKKIILIFGFMLILLSSFASASILHEQLLDDGSVKPQGLTQEGFSFTANKTTTVTGLSLRLSRDGSPGTCYIDWYDTSGELPSGSTLSTTSFNGDSLGNTHPAVSMTNITLNTEVSVTYNTKYAIILKCPDGDSGNRIRFYEYEASDVYADGGRIYSTNGGSSFTSILGHDAETIVYYGNLNATPTTPTDITFNPTTVYSNTNFSVNASGSTDLDNDTITYYYQFYDENTSTILKSYSTDNYLQLTSTQAHNNIKVYVKATDGNSFSSNYSEQITVSNTLPTTPTTITGLPSGLYVGDTLTVTGSGSTDLIDNDILTYEYKFYNLNDSTILQDWSSDNTYKIVGTDIRNTILIYARANDGYGVSSSYSVSDFVDGANIDLRLTNEYDGTNIDIFSLTFENGTTLSTINNSIVFPTINPTETFNISSTGFITRNFNNYIIEDEINLTLYQALIEVTVSEKITGTTINSFNVTDGTYTGTTTNGTAYFYGNVGSYTLTVNSENYYSEDYNINLTSLEQTSINQELGNVNLTINAYYIFGNISINNFTITATLGSYSESKSTTTGSLEMFLIQDEWNLTIIPEGEFESKTINITLDELIETYNFNLYDYNSINITIYSEETGDLITDNITIDVSNDEGQVTYYRTNSSLYLKNLTTGSYIFSLYGDDYSNRFYSVEVSEGSHQNLNAYLINSTSSVIFTVYDSNNGAIIEGASMSIERIVDNVWTLIASKESDISGKIQLIYEPNIKYRFSTSKEDYITKIFELNPILYSEYDINLEQDSTQQEQPTYSNINIIYYVNPVYAENNISLISTTFKDDFRNNFTIIFNNPTGEFVNYGYTITYPAGSNSSIGNNAYGSSLNIEFNITNANLFDVVELNYNYTLSDGTFKSFDQRFMITPSNTTYTITNLQNNTFGMGIFERVLIVVGITILFAGLIGLMSGAIAGGGVAIFILGYFTKSGFINIWVSITSIILILFWILWRSE